MSRIARYRLLVLTLVLLFTPVLSLIDVQRAIAEGVETTAEVNNTSEQTATTGDATVTSESEPAALSAEEPAETEATQTPQTQPEEQDAPVENEQSTEEAQTVNSEEQTNVPPVESCNTENPELETAYAGGTETTSITNNAIINNQQCSTATSGDATVAQADDASAQSGSAQSVANIVNLINNINTDGSAPVIYSEDIFGTSFGDILLSLGLSDQNSSCSVCAGNVTVNANSTINNNIYLSANSGEAVVSGADQGNAASGNATVLLNLVNIINTQLGSGQTFIGFLNIYGDLDGDILLPPSALEELMRYANANNNQTQSSSVSLSNYQNITNNIELNATSGDAYVGASQGGSATSGDATTSINSINIANTQVTGGSSLLVFINVMGSWVGMILNNPAGTTQATLGNNASSICSVCSGSVDALTNSAITNTIRLDSVSGNATVQDSNYGIATTGDASASLNIVNIINTQLNMGGWFGVMFINVFGSWNGSFGIDTAAGEVAKPQPKPTPNITGVGGETVNGQTGVTLSEGSLSEGSRRTALSVSNNDDGSENPAAVLAESESPILEFLADNESETGPNQMLFWILVSAASALLLGLFGLNARQTS